MAPVGFCVLFERAMTTPPYRYRPNFPYSFLAIAFTRIAMPEPYPCLLISIISCR